MKALVNVVMTLALLINAVVVVAVLTSCGGDSTAGGYDNPSPPPPPPEDKAWAAIKPLVDAKCVKCHDGVKQKPALTSGAAFKASKAKDEITTGAMPPAPNPPLDADTKAKLLAYLGG